MNKFLLLAVAFLLAAGLYACKQEEAPTIHIPKTSQTVDPNGGVVDIYLQTNVANYTVRIEPETADWISPIVSKSGTLSVASFNYKANPEIAERSVKLHFSSSDGLQSQIIQIRQQAKAAPDAEPTIIILKTAYTVEPEGGVVEVYLQSGEVTTTIAPTAPWVSQNISKTGILNLLLFSCQANDTYAERSTTIEVLDRDGLQPKMIQIKQKAKRSLRHQIAVPSVDGLIPLKCDFHLHTVFSDGVVWPTVRVDEAARDGLDAIALTDHIEYRPQSGDFSTQDLNRPYDLALSSAQRKGILLIRGIEITRSKPEGGHLNALFLSDANLLKQNDPNKQINAAADQGAFVIWNHPGWPATPQWIYEPNERWIAEGKVHAVEIYNGIEFYPRTISWLTPFNLAPIAASDLHDPVDAFYAPGIRRPMTLVFAKERSLEALKEALFARRSVAWFSNQLAGNAEWLEKLFLASVSIKRRGEQELEWINHSDILFEIWVSGLSKPLILDARESEVIALTGVEGAGKPLSVKITNAHVTEDQVLELKIKL